MLQFHVELCCIRVTLHTRCNINLFVALDLVSNVLGFILIENSCGQYEQEADLPATNLGFPPHSKLQGI